MDDSAARGLGGEPINAAEPAVVINEDGSAVVDFDGEQKPPPPTLAFSDNLTTLFTEQELQKLGHEIVQLVDEDDRSRAEWKKTYAQGLKLLGLQYEEKQDPWPDACGAFHPMLLESVIRFNAQAMMDIFPGSGPVKTEIIGDNSPEVEAQSTRIRHDMNWLAKRRIKGYRLETDMMLFNLPLAGTAFRKFGFDEKRLVPWAEYVLPEHVVMPYTAASLDTTPRYTVILPKTHNWVLSKMRSGFFRDVEIGQPVFTQTEIDQAKDKIEGKANTNQAKDYLHRLYECHIEYEFAELAEIDGEGLKPYVVTVDKTSTKVLAIRRDWKEGDKAVERQVNLVQHKYMPGFGPYGIGLINILGGLTESATSILRQLVDAGTLANLPAGFKTKTTRIKDDSSPLAPGEWRDAEVGAGSLKEAFFPLPYGEPSTVLAALLGQIVDEGRRIGSVADMKITDMTGQNMPVGTTLAIIERSMKVMSAVQQRLYESFTQELKVLHEIIRDFMGEIPYPFRLKAREQQATRKQDYDDRVDVLPVADPNASTQAQRIMVMQAVIQLTQTAPQIYNLKEVHRDMITVLGSEKGDLYVPPDEEVMPADPVTENMNLLTGKPVKAGIMQDHKAHLIVHMDAARDPKIAQMLQNNPAAPAILSATNAHILEHVAFQYRKEMEEQLGVQLPPPSEPLPEDVEYHLSGLAAKAASKLLQKNTAEAQQQEMLEKMQDPVVQIQLRDSDTKRMEAETKRMKLVSEIDANMADSLKDILLEVFKEMSETERTAIMAQVQKGATLSSAQLKEAEIAAELGSGVMGKIVDMMITRYNTKAKKEIEAAKPKPASKAAA